MELKSIFLIKINKGKWINQDVSNVGYLFGGSELKSSVNASKSSLVVAFKSNLLGTDLLLKLCGRPNFFVYSVFKAAKGVTG